MKKSKLFGDNQCSGPSHFASGRREIVGAIIWQVFGNRVTDAVSKQEEVTIVVFHRWFTPGSWWRKCCVRILVGEQIVSGNEYVNAYITNVWLEDYVMQIPQRMGRLWTLQTPPKDYLYRN